MNCIAIIDGNYINNVAKQYKMRNSNLPHSIFNVFERYKKEYCSNLHLLRIRYHDSPGYLSNPPTNDEQKHYDTKESFFTKHIKNYSRMELVRGRCVKREFDNGTPKYEQKGVDVNIAIDIIKYSKTISSLLVFTLDSDLIPAFDLGRNNGAETILVTSEQIKVSPGGSIEKLIHACDVHITMKEQDFKDNNSFSKKYFYFSE